MDDGRDEDFLRLARERYRRAIEAERDSREAMLDDLRFRAGDQWPEDVKAERAERPCLTINMMPQFIRQVSGDVRLNKPSITVKPVSGGADREKAAILTGLIRAIEHASLAQVAYSGAVDASATCGIGHFRVDTEFTDDDVFEQDIRIRRIRNPLAVAWDPDAQEITKEDARYCFITETMTPAAFRAAYPGAATADFPAEGSDESLRPWRDGENVVVAEYWVKQPAERTLALMPDGAVRDVTEIAEPELARLAPLRLRRVRAHQVRSYLVSGLEILEGPTDWPGRYIPIVPVLGEEVHVGRETVTHGLVRFAKDPQRIYNYSRSAATEAVALAPKAPFVGTARMFAEHESYWRRANRKNLAYLPYTPDPEAPGARPERQPAPEIQLAYGQEATLAARDINATTGLHPPALGQASNETSGVAIEKRQREGDVGTFVYVDNLAIALGYAGRILVDLIPKIYDSTRVVMVIGEDETERFVEINRPALNEQGETVLLNDLAAGRYDVRVSTGPSFTTRRDAAAASMVEFIRAAPETATVVMDLLARNLDWPGSEEMAKRFRRIAVARGLAEPEQGEGPDSLTPVLGAQAEKAEAEALRLRVETLKEQVETLKLRAQAEKLAREAEGQELDNAGKALLLSSQAGQLEAAVAAAVETVLARLADGALSPDSKGETE